MESLVTKGVKRWIETATAPSEVVAALVCFGWEQVSNTKEEWTARLNGVQITVKRNP